MAEVKWIKICTDIFDDEKILLIESMPEADSIIAIWFKLLCTAGKQNNGGVFMLNDKVAYTDEMFATIFRRPLNTVRLALQTFENFGMVEIVNNTYTIPNWEKHQSLDRLEQAKEQTRQRVARHREKQKLLAECNAVCNVTDRYTVTQCNADRIEEDKDKDKEEDKIRERIDYGQIKDLYNDICISLPRLTVLSDKRKKAIKARLNTYTIEQFKEMFTKAQASDFLKGKSKSDWQANFDWLIKDANFAKVLDGNYDNKRGGKSAPSSLDLPEYEKLVEGYIPTLPKTAADDESIKAKAEALKRQIAGG
jgi:predicted phage replisome organizer